MFNVLSPILGFVNKAYASTTLQPGDLAVLGFNADDPFSPPTQRWALVALADIPVGEVIYMTDRGINSTDGGNSYSFYTIANDSTLTWTVTTQVPAGTVLTMTQNDGTGALKNYGTVSGNLGVFSGIGDQIIIYQGSNIDSVSSSTFIYAFSNTQSISIPAAGSWNNASLSVQSESWKPPGLNDRYTAVLTSNVANTPIGPGDMTANSYGYDNMIYYGTAGRTTAATKNEILDAIHNPLYWKGHNSTPWSIGTGGSDVFPTTFLLSQAAASPTVTSTTPATSVTSTGATVGGNVTSDGGATLTERGVVYSTTVNPTTSDTKVAESGTTTGTFTVNLTSLTASTTYHYRAYATNSQGTSYGADATFTTSANAAPTATSVTVSGTAQVGQTLTGNYTYSDAESNAEGTSTFKWYRADDAAGTNKTAIGSATSTTYTLAAGDVGKYISFEVTPIAATGTTTGTAVESSRTSAVAAAQAAPTATSVSISGTEQVGQTLTGTYTYNDVNNDAEGTSTFKWYRANDAAGTGKTAISGATSTTYTLIAGDVGKYISFEVTPIAATGTTTGTAVESSRTNAITLAQAAPTATSVTVSGTAQVGQTLTGNYTYNDVNNDAEGTSTFKWYRADDAAGANKTAISGATSTTYTLAAGDLGKYISFEVTPIAATGTTTGTAVESSRTNAVTPAEAAPTATSVSISGTANAGATLTGNYTYGDVNNDLEGTSTFKWYRSDDTSGTNKTAISGATSLTYVLQVADVGKYITFEVTPVAASGTTTGTAVESSYTSQVVLVQAAPTASAVTISGTARLGQTLTGSYTYNDVNGDAEATSTFKWYRANDAVGTGKTAISGATSSTYVLVQADVGKYISFEVTPIAATGTTTGTAVESSRTTIVLGSSNANLSGLTLSSGTLSPTFSGNTTTYTASVGNGTSGITVTPTKADANATIQVRVNGGSYSTVTSGSASSNLALSVGTNTIEVKVTAQDGTVKTYTMTVTRASGSGGSTDTTPPTVSSVATANTTSSSTTLKAKSSEAGTMYYVVTTSSTAPTAQQIVNGKNHIGVTATKYGHGLTTANALKNFAITGLSSSTKYYVYVVSKDTSGNVSSVQRTSLTTLSDDDPVVKVNDQIQEKVATAKRKNIGGQDTLIITLDADKLKKRISNKKKPVVLIPVSATADDFVTSVNGTLLKEMYDKDAILNIQTKQSSYYLPITEINISGVAKQLGQQVALKDIQFTIKMTEATSSQANNARKGASKVHGQVIVAPVNFEVRATYNKKQVVVDAFNNFVEREITLPAGVNPNRITTGVIVLSNGTIVHVPTKVTKRNGRYYALINSLTNSTYSVIWNVKTFNDISNHWAKKSIQNMASRLVVTGATNTLYKPNSAMTRGEFAETIVSALGLTKYTQRTYYSDVSVTSKRYKAIQIATQYGLLKGYPDGKYRPNDTITREQAAMIVARAVALTSLNATMTPDMSRKVLAKYRDQVEVSRYAQSSVALVMKYNLLVVSGKDLKIKQAITRAEVAVLMERFLQKADLIEIKK